MSEFVNFEAVNDDRERDMMDECERLEERESDREFIDDSEYDVSVTDYYGFTNVTKFYEEAMRERALRMRRLTRVQRLKTIVRSLLMQLLIILKIQKKGSKSLSRACPVRRGKITPIHSFIQYFTL